MNNNEQLLHTFYSAFKNKDYATMQRCYAPDAVFNDEVFKNLDAKQAGAMWEMLIKKGTDLELEFSNIQADDKKGSAEWVATYTFSQTKNKVVNKIKAEFEFENGLIKKHTDSFSFYNWASQALGFTGVVLGATSFIRNKVSDKAMEALSAFINKKSE